MQSKLDNVKSAHSKGIVRDLHLLDALMENNPTAIVVLDTSGNVARCNPAFEKLFGYREVEILGNPVDNFITNRESFREAVDYTYRVTHGEIIRITGCRYGKNGNPIYVEIQGVPVEIEGKVVGVLTLYHDITDHKLAEKSLKDMNDSFIRMMNGIDADVYISDLQSYQILFMNDHMRQSFGHNLIGEICYRHFRGLDDPCPHCTNKLLLDANGVPTNPIVWEAQNPITQKWYKNSDCAIRWIDNRFVRLQIATDITEMKKVQENLIEMATHDSLTGLPNRILFRDRLEHALTVASRNETSLAVLFLDLDKFKNVNDTHGHDTGDLLLQETSRRMNSCLRESDTLARLYGDEFTILLEQIPLTEAVHVATRIRERMRIPFIFFDKVIKVTVSIGISLFPQSGKDADTILQQADQAMYVVKKKGGDGIGY